MKHFHAAKKRATVSVGESARIVRELQALARTSSRSAQGFPNQRSRLSRMTVSAWEWNARRCLLERVTKQSEGSLRLGRPRIFASTLHLRPRCGGERLILRPEGLEIVFIELFEVDQRVVRTLRRANELVQLHLDRLGVAVLSALNQEDHQERHDRGCGVDHQLPGVAEAEDRTADRPRQNERGGNDKHLWPTAEARRGLGKVGKPGGIAHEKNGDGPRFPRSEITEYVPILERLTSGALACASRIPSRRSCPTLRPVSRPRPSRCRKLPAPGRRVGLDCPQ